MNLTRNRYWIKARRSITKIIYIKTLKVNTSASSLFKNDGMIFFKVFQHLRKKIYQT